jgi:signal peptide peptidase SppA
MRDLIARLPFLNRRPTVAVVRLQGAIAAGPRGLNDAGVGPLIETAMRGKPAALALEVNSPGGSAVQSSLIAARIRRLAEEKKIPVLAFVEDVAASGGFWLATAADEIFVDPASIVGSVGVISAGFGAQDAIARVGIERRVHTAGRSKSMLDPFTAEKPEDVARLDGWLAQLHDVFIAYVRARRGARRQDNPDHFTGEVWIGQAAVDQGLVDGIGHLVPVCQARFGQKVRFRRYGQKRSILSRFGLNLAQDALALVEERALMARFGL